MSLSHQVINIEFQFKKGCVCVCVWAGGKFVKWWTIFICGLIQIWWSLNYTRWARVCGIDSTEAHILMKEYFTHLSVLDIQPHLSPLKFNFNTK